VELPVIRACQGSLEREGGKVPSQRSVGETQPVTRAGASKAGGVHQLAMCDAWSIQQQAVPQQKPCPLTVTGSQSPPNTHVTQSPTSGSASPPEPPPPQRTPFPLVLCSQAGRHTYSHTHMTHVSERVWPWALCNNIMQSGV
jgi:hypothetical protein